MFAAAQDRLAVDVADAQALRLKAAKGDREALVGAAKQFESLLVAQMLKGMRQTRFNDEDDPMTGGDSLRLYQDLLDQQWAGQIAKGRGLGFAEMMVKAMERQPAASPEPTQGSSAPVAETATASGTADSEMGSAPSAAAGKSPSSPPGRATAPKAGSPADFIARMRPHAEAVAAEAGVPADFILGHAALESGWGRHEIKDAEGKASHNLFGIKAGRNWDGAVAETLTTEYRQGVAMKLSQKFRAYSDYGSAFADYANLLKARYGDALEGGAEATSFARGLAAGGYATDPAYADKLQSVIARVAMAAN